MTSVLFGNSFDGAALRQPPMNISAEQGLLGALMANNKALVRVVDFLRPEHFADPVHTRIYQRISERVLDGQIADAVTLRGDFENSGVLEEVGGTQYLAQLLAAMVAVDTAAPYGKVIHDAWIRRELISIGENIVNTAFGTAPAAVAQIEQAQLALAAISGAGRGDRQMSLGEAVERALRQAEDAYRGARTPAVMTYMPTVDKALGGLWPGDFDLLAGIPGAGKTSLAVQIAFSIAKQTFDVATAAGATPEDAIRLPGVALFSLEMSAEELGAKVISYCSAISVERLRTGQFDMVEADRMVQAAAQVNYLPVRIHDCRRTSVRMLGAKARLHLQRQPEALAIVDHLLVSDQDDRGRGNDVASVTKAARDYKTLAGDLNIPFLVLTHAGRASADRSGYGRPTLRDVKWAGEGDADAVLFVHRPILHMDHSPPPKRDNESDEKHHNRAARWRAERDAAADRAEIVVAKRRMGPTGVWVMRFDGPTMSFREVEQVSDV